MAIQPTSEARQLPVSAEDGGEAQDGTVLYVHGTMDSSAVFARRTSAQLPRWSALTYDRRGWGSARQSGHDSCGLGTHVADLLEILRTYSPDIVVGHSYGGLVALNAIASEPSLVGALVVYEPPVRWLPWWPDEAPWEALVRQIGLDDPERATLELRGAVVGKSSHANTRRDPRIDHDDGVSLLTEMTDPELNQVGFDPLDFDVPLIASAGEKSMEHHRRVTLGLAHLVVDGTYVELPGAGHIPHVSDPEAFFALVPQAARARRARP